MLARWPSLFIQESITAAASAWPRAMFSPPRPVMPAFSARTHGVAPSGSVWSKKPRVAMSELNAPARAASRASAFTGEQPTFARSALTRRRTSASAATPRSAVEGAEVFSTGASVVGSGFGAGAFVVGAAVVLGLAGLVTGAFDGALAGVFAGVFVGALVGVGVAFGVGFADGVADGAAALPASLPVLAEEPVPDGVSAGVRVDPPCVISSGAWRAWLGRSLVPTLPIVKVSPPGSRPEATATAPTATAAEAPSSPVRMPRRLRRAPRCRWSAPAA